VGFRYHQEVVPRFCFLGDFFPEPRPGVDPKGVKVVVSPHDLINLNSIPFKWNRHPQRVRHSLVSTSSTQHSAPPVIIVGAGNASSGPYLVVGVKRTLTAIARLSARITSRFSSLGSKLIA